MLSGKAYTVIADRELQELRRIHKADLDATGMPVADGVRHRLLSDAEEMSRHRFVRHEDRLLAGERALNREDSTGPRRQLFESRHKPGRFEIHGRQSAGQIPGERDGFAHMRGDFSDPRCLGGVAGGQPLLKHLTHQLDARQLLAQPVVQVVADPTLLVLARVQDVLLKAFPLSDIPNETREDPTIRKMNLADRKVHGKYGTVLPPPGHLTSDADDLRPTAS